MIYKKKTLNMNIYLLKSKVTLLNILFYYLRFIKFIIFKKNKKGKNYQMIYCINKLYNFLLISSNVFLRKITKNLLNIIKILKLT